VLFSVAFVCLELCINIIRLIINRTPDTWTLMDLRQDLCARESTPVSTTVSKELADCSFRAVQEWYLYTSLHSAVLYSKDWCLDGVRLRGGSVFVHGFDICLLFRGGVCFGRKSFERLLEMFIFRCCNACMPILILVYG
jgi:hypothetical protein